MGLGDFPATVLVSSVVKNIYKNKSLAKVGNSGEWFVIVSEKVKLVKSPRHNR